MRRYARKLYKRLVPKRIRRKLAEYAKGVIAASGGVLIGINELSPALADDAQRWVTVGIAVLVWLGVVRKGNRPPENKVAP